MVHCKLMALAVTIFVSITIRATRVKRHEVRSVVKQLSEDAKTGKVVVVSDGQSKNAGVTVGMIIRKPDGVDYTRDLLRQKKEGDADYTAVLDRPREQPLISEPSGSATSALHYEADQDVLEDIFGSEATTLYAEQPLNNELRRTTSPTSDVRHKDSSFDALFGEESWGLDDDPLASRDDQHRHGPHEGLPQDSPTAKRVKWTANKGEPREYKRWSANEDEDLTKLVEEQIGKNRKGRLLWEKIASHFPSRNGNHCRQRWDVYLRPELNKMKKSGWTPEEDQEIWDCVQEVGTKWTKIAKLYMRSRSAKDISNRWYVIMRKNHGVHKRFLQDKPTVRRGKRSAEEGKHLEHKWTPDEDEQLKKLVEEHDSKTWAAFATHFQSRSGKQCRGRWLHHLRPELNNLKKSGWTPEEDQEIRDRVQELGTQWTKIAKLYMSSRSAKDISNRWYIIRKKIQQE